MAGPTRHQQSGTGVSKTGRTGPPTITTSEIQWAVRHLTNQMHGETAAFLDGPYRPPPSATCPIKWPETFTGVCGPFGAPPARTCLGRWRAPYLRGAACPHWGARPCRRLFLRSVSPAADRHRPNEMARNIHRRLWPLWGTPSTHLFGPVAGSVSPGGVLPALGGPPLPPPFFAIRIDRVRWTPNQ